MTNFLANGSFCESKSQLYCSVGGCEIVIDDAYVNHVCSSQMNLLAYIICYLKKEKKFWLMDFGWNDSSPLYKVDCKVIAFSL